MEARTQILDRLAVKYGRHYEIEKKQLHDMPSGVKLADEKPCDKCGTVIHVGVASGRGAVDANLCLSCLHDRDRLDSVYNMWSVIESQRFVPE